MHFYHISLISSYNKKCFRQTLQRKSKHTSHVQIVFFENREIKWKNMEEPDRPQMTIWRMRIACWKPKTTNAKVSMCNNYSLFT